MSSSCNMQELEGVIASLSKIDWDEVFNRLEELRYLVLYEGTVDDIEFVFQEVKQALDKQITQPDTWCRLLYKLRAVLEALELLPGEKEEAQMEKCIEAAWSEWPPEYVSEEVIECLCEIELKPVIKEISTIVDDIINEFRKAGITQLNIRNAKSNTMLQYLQAER